MVIDWNDLQVWSCWKKYVAGVSFKVQERPSLPFSVCESRGGSQLVL